MAISFTPQQQQVIDERDCNILVSAAAGSGKTAVLVERILCMICDEKQPVDIDRLLIVTFTSAAAAQMRERIAAGIEKRLLEQPQSRHLQRQATLLHNAQITTIDSFSLYLLRNHFHEIGLDPAFRVADEGEIRLLQQEVLAQLLEEAFAAQEEAFLDCVESFCPSGKEHVLEQHILQLSRYAASFPWPAQWLAQRKSDYDANAVEELLSSDYGRYLYRYVKRMLHGCVEKFEQLQEICERPDGPYMYGELVEKELAQLRQLAECPSLQDYADKVPAMSFGRLPSKKDDSVSADLRELVKNRRAEVKKVLQGMTEKFFLTPFPLAVLQSKECAGKVATLIDLVLSFDRRMQEKKQEKKIVDFSDMEHFALDILLEQHFDEQGRQIVSPSAVAKEYRSYFQEVLVDEYQDSNLVQEYLLWAVSGEEEGRYNRFMVGDVKQSIYRFRLARPELFLEKYDTYDCSGQEKASCRRIDLSKNFRSRTEVVDAVNDVFSHMMSKEIGGIVYDEAAALYPGAVYPPNEQCDCEFLLLDKSSLSAEGVNWNAKQAEGAMIAQKIKQLRTSGLVTDASSGALRPVQYSDIVILLRSNSGWDEELKTVLTAEGIPVHITTRTGYFASTQVQEILQLLRVLDNPRQDVAFCGVMRSVFGGFSDEEMAIVRAGRKECVFCDAAKDFVQTQGAKAETATLAEKVKTFLEKIERYRSYTVYMPIRELLQKLVEDSDYLNYVTALPGGSKRRANVELLFAKASDFEKTSYFGLFHFIRYMEQLEKYEVDFGEADLLDEQADVVRIMSIHKSKGLEFPITFVAGLGKRFNMQDVRANLLVDMDLGLATDYVDAKRRLRNKTLRRTVLSCKMKEDSLAEELRVLYVAFTRAKEKLILTGSLEQAMAKWQQAQLLHDRCLRFLDFVEAGSYLDFLLPILSKTKIAVSVQSAQELTGELLRENISALDRRKRLLEAGEQADRQTLLALERRFSFVYPHQGLKDLYTKTTVSELKHAALAEAEEEAATLFAQPEVTPYVPRFEREERKESPTVRGNAFHRAMELLDFDALLAETFLQMPQDYTAYQHYFAQAKEQIRDRLEQFLQEKTTQGVLSKAYYDVLQLRKLMHFLEGELAYRMWKAQVRGELYREQPFVYGIAANRLGAQFPPEETVLIQGIVDVFFVEQGQIVLLDYKTDRVPSMSALWERYAVQLQYYEEALASLTGMPVKEKFLYSFSLEMAENG